MNVMVGSASDDLSDELDFDADLAIWIDLAFHTEVYPALLKSARTNRFFFAAILVNNLS